MCGQRSRQKEEEVVNGAEMVAVNGDEMVVVNGAETVEENNKLHEDDAANGGEMQADKFDNDDNYWDETYKVEYGIRMEQEEEVQLHIMKNQSVSL